MVVAFKAPPIVRKYPCVFCKCNDADYDEMNVEQVLGNARDYCLNLCKEGYKTAPAKACELCHAKTAKFKTALYSETEAASNVLDLLRSIKAGSKIAKLDAEPRKI